MRYYNNRRRTRTVNSRDFLTSRIIPLLILFSILLGLFYYNNYLVINSNVIDDESDKIKIDDNLDEIEKPSDSVGVSLIENLFTKNFENMSESILDLFKAEAELNITTFLREGNNRGKILDDTLYSLENLLFYDTLALEEINAVEAYQFYLGLTRTPLYLEGNLTEHEYGFIESLNGTTGERINDQRNLYDNLMPIHIMIDNDVHKLISEGITIVENTFKLINSSYQFWDETNLGFFPNNVTSNLKYTSDNFYAIQSLLLIHKSDYINAAIKNQAYDLANETMVTLMNKMWDDTEDGFFYSADGAWYAGVGGPKYKHLETNALGITTLLDMWLATGRNVTSYFDNATLLYNKINEELWNATHKAYETRRDDTWGSTGDAQADQTLDLKANLAMMEACLKLFELTGEMQYYDQALKVFNFIENNLYNDTISAYMNSIGFGDDKNIDFYYNMELCDSYLYGAEIYNSTYLTFQLNTTDFTPDLKVDQDILNITSAYYYKRKVEYYAPQASEFRFYKVITNITDANITYIFRYPNLTIHETTYKHIKPNRTIGVEKEEFQIECVADTAGSLNMTYFNISTPSTNYSVYIDLNFSIPIPPVIPGRTVINVSSIQVDDTNKTVANRIFKALETYRNGKIFHVEKDDNVVTVRIEEKGYAINATDGPPANATGFGFETLEDGYNVSYSKYSLLYPITEDLPLSNTFKEHTQAGIPYEITIYANSSKFAMAYNNPSFNVISGLENKTIKGFDELDAFYQGQAINITLPVESTRLNNLTVNITLEGDSIIDTNKTNILIKPEDTTNVGFNVTALPEVSPGFHSIKFTFTKGNYVYLTVKKQIEISNTLDYSNLIYNKELVVGEDIDISLTLINFIPINTQLFNLSFSGDYITDQRNPIQLDVGEQRVTSTFDIETLDEIVEDTIEIEMSISKGTTELYTETITMEVVPAFEIISITFPETVTQWEPAHLILIVRNNLDTSEEFTLELNDEEIVLDKTELGPGDNRIEYETIITYNPYDFSTRKYTFTLKDSSDDVIVQYNFEVESQISTLNLVLFYMIPIIVPIGIILYYKNKDLRYKLLRR